MVPLPSVTIFTKDVNPSLAKPPLDFNGSTSLAKYAILVDYEN